MFVEPQDLDEAPEFLQDAGETGRIVAAFPWESTPLGPLESWTACMRMTTAMVLRSPAAMALLWGPEGILIYNDAYAVIAGERHPSALGTDARKSWPEIAEFNDHVLRHVLAAGSLNYADQELTIARSGVPEQAWFTLDYSPVLDEAARPVAVLAVVQETTAKVRALAWEREEHERLQQMFEQAPGFAAMLRGPEHRFELVNAAYMQLVGHRDIVGKGVREALPDIAGQGFYELLDEVFRSGKAFTASALKVALQRTPLSQPELRYVDLVYQPIVDPRKHVVGIFAQGADVTDRVLAERAVQREVVRNRQILDGAVDYAIIAFDLQGRVTHWNEGARRILGWAEAEMSGQDGARLFTAEDRLSDVPTHEMAQAVAQGKVSTERWHLRKSGERFWAAGEMTPIRDEAGQTTGFVKVLRDRTEQHEAAEALRQADLRLRRAQRAGGVGTFTMDLVAMTVSGTDEFFAIFGVSAARGPIAIPEFENMVLPEDAAIPMHSGKDPRNAGLDVEYRIRRANDGALRWIARKAELETDEAGRALRMLGVVQDITERKAAHRAVEESEAQFRTFAQTLPNHVWTAPPDGMLDWFNDRVYDYSGMTLPELAGQGWAQLVHPDELALASEQWALALARSENYETEFRVRRADGIYRWHLVRAVPIRSTEGRLVRWVGTNTDIHERKLAEAQTARDRDRIWMLSQELMLSCDKTGVILSVNPTGARLLGWTEEEMVGASLADFVHPDDIATTAEEVAKLADGRTTLAFENRYRSKAGAYRLLNWTAVPDGENIHGVARDVTDERLASAERERIWSSTNDLMATVGRDGTLRSVNPAWSRLLGYEDADLLARPLRLRTDDEGQVLLDRVLSQVNSGAQAKEFELAMPHRDGGRSRVAWAIDAVDHILYMVGRDVTEQRAAEEALRQGMKMEAIGQLTGGIAHDFNNLLQGITGSLTLIRKLIEKGRFDEVERFLGNALNSAKRAAALTHRLLAFSRRQPLDPRPVEVNPLLTSMDDLLRRSLGERVELQLRLADALWLTKCDANQLENAILNLVINSRDAMPDGGLLVIETANALLDNAMAAKQQGVEPGRYVCLGVTDTGSGMSAEIATKAFEPFFTTKPIGQGTGLGLSMIYGFVRQSGGYSQIYSEPGKGTTVKLYLPQYRGEMHTEEPLPELSGQHQSHGDEIVLVVEDEPIVRELIVAMLQELGYQTLEAADGPAGLALLQSPQRITLLITDVGLPGLNGRQVADAARITRPAMKVLFMTGYAENATMAAGFLEPGMTMITKPFAMEVMASKIRDILASA